MIQDEEKVGLIHTGALSQGARRASGRPAPALPQMPWTVPPPQPGGLKPLERAARDPLPQNQGL